MITDLRMEYRPFEYNEPYEIYLMARSAHWTPDEVNIAGDILNWNKDLTADEKEIIGGILKGFTQMEVLVGDYWRKIANWFPKPEIQMMCSAFSYFETIHQTGYALINEQLGLDDFRAFLYDETTKNKLDYFLDNGKTDTKSVGTKLAIFSAFGEGVSLFSSFAILLSFQKAPYGLLKGIAQIVSWSISDENLHSNGGVWLFNKLCEETPGLKEELRKDIIEAATTVYDLEIKFISELFKDRTIRTLTYEQLENFIRNRINKKLEQMGYEALFKVNNDLLSQMSWFNLLSSGKEFGDFFAVKPTAYTETNFNQTEMW